LRVRVFRGSLLKGDPRITRNKQQTMLSRGSSDTLSLQ
jgi:hypothetical protein